MDYGEWFLAYVKKCFPGDNVQWCFIRDWGRIGLAGQVREAAYATAAEAREALTVQRRMTRTGPVHYGGRRAHSKPDQQAGLRFQKMAAAGGLAHLTAEADAP